MTVLSRFLCAGILLASLCAGTAQAERRVADTLEAPQFHVGCQVIWSDGSRGKIVMQPELRDGEWYYSVQLGGEDGLCWSLPERGLRME